MTQCFSAPPAAAIVDRNCFSVSLYSAPKPGDMAFIRVASYYPVTMFSQDYTPSPVVLPKRNTANWMCCQATRTALR
ncbi:D-alanyl-D-alanine carboxypeptidase [Escherichia coli]